MSRQWTADEIASFHHFERAGDADALAIERGREPRNLINFKKHYPKFKPVLYCEWLREQDEKLPQENAHAI